jgi:RNA polymerase sigma-70 factor (ECF subfamily)
LRLSNTLFGREDFMTEAEGAEDELSGALTDEEIVDLVRRGDTTLFEVLMRRYNQRLYRTARGIVRDPALAEDVMQQGYINAYFHLDQFAGRSRFATWLTRIVINEALARVRQEAARASAVAITGGEPDGCASDGVDPEHQTFANEMNGLIEAAVEALPEGYRLVVMLREFEGLSTAETAACLCVATDVVKTRLSRARRLLRAALQAPVGRSAASAFRFDAPRCNLVVAAVNAAIRRLSA